MYKAKKVIISGVSHLVLHQSKTVEVVVEKNSTLDVKEEGGVLTIKQTSSPSVGSIGGRTVKKKFNFFGSVFSSMTFSSVQSDGDVSISGNNININSGNVTIKDNQVFIKGKYICNTNGATSVKVVNDKVYLNGKLVTEADAVPLSAEEQSDLEDAIKPIVVEIPVGNVSLHLTDCKEVESDAVLALDEFSFGSSAQATAKCNSISASKSTSKTTGQSTMKIQSLTTSSLVLSASGQSICKIKEGSIGHMAIGTDGQSTCKVEAKLETVIANATGMSTCKFTRPTNPAIVNKDFMSTIKEI